jgi:hypothetical protein
MLRGEAMAEVLPPCGEAVGRGTMRSMVEG